MLSQAFMFEPKKWLRCFLVLLALVLVLVLVAAVFVAVFVAVV